MENNQSGKLKGIHCRTNGNAMIFVVIVLFTLVCFFVFTIHVGQRVTNKIAMQNAADASVLSGAVWQARGLNLISALNVTMTECLALIIMFKAFDSTLKYANALYPVNLASYRACCEETGDDFCCDSATCTLPNPVSNFLEDMEDVNASMRRLYGEHPETLWEFMSSLRAVENGVALAFPAMALTASSEIAQQNGADRIAQVGGDSFHAAFWPILERLPLKDGNYPEDICYHTWEGGPGYDNYLCMDSAMEIEAFGERVNDLMLDVWRPTDEVLFPDPSEYYQSMVDLHYKSLCSSGDSETVSSEEDMATVECDVCSLYGGDSEWYLYEISVSTPECDMDKFNARPKGFEKEPENFYNGDLPPGQIVNPDADTCQKCNIVQIGENAYVMEAWIMNKCIYSHTVSIDREDTSHRPRPLVLTENWQDWLTFNSLVFRDGTGAPPENGDPSLYYAYLGEDGEPVLSLRSDTSGEMITYGDGGNSYINPAGTVEIPKNTWSVARAEVYNPEPDLFNQNWHAKLAPSDVDSLRPDSFYGHIPLPAALQNLPANAEDVVDEVLLH